MSNQILVGSNFTGFKNRIINGDFSVNQRQDTLVNNESKYTVDRVYTDAINSEVVVTNEAVYSFTEGAMVNDTNPFRDNSQVNLYQFEDNAIDKNKNNNGIINKCYFKNGKFGQCLLVNVDNTSHVEVDNISKIFDETNKTVSCWFSKMKDASMNNIITSATNSSKNEVRCCFNISSIHIYQGTDISYSNYPKDNGWHHYLFTVDSNGTRVFIDGKLVAKDKRTVINDSGVASYPAYSIGNHWYNITHNSFGTPNIKIDQLRIFNRALTYDEVKKLYVEDYQYIQKKHLKIEVNSKGTNPTINPYIYKFESRHIADIIKESMSLSFDFYSNKTGLYNVKLVTKCLDGTQETFKTTFNYTDSGFERIEISIPKETFTKNITNDEELGATLYIASNVENNANVYIIRLANVQLEEGDIATEFEYVPYDIQLQRCMRYYEVPLSIYGLDYVSGAHQFCLHCYKIMKRTSPTLTYTLISDNNAAFTADYSNIQYIKIYIALNSATYSYLRNVTADAEL